MDTTAVKSAAVTQGNAPAESVTLLRRIGPTTVEVTVHFSKASNETMADITRRLISRTIESEEFNRKAGGEKAVPFTPPKREVMKCA